MVSDNPLAVVVNVELVLAAVVEINVVGLGVEMEVEVAGHVATASCTTAKE